MSALRVLSVVVLALLTRELAHASDELADATRATVELREALLVSPAEAARRFCAGGLGAFAQERGAGSADGPRAQPACAATLRWRRDLAFVDLCSDLSRHGDDDGSAWRPRRYYEIETRCVLRIGRWTWALPLLRATPMR